MISFDTPLALLLAIPLFTLAVIFWRNGFVNLDPRRGQLALLVRLAILAAIVLGLAGIGFDLGQSRQASVIVADLSASDIQAQSQMENFINRAAARRPVDDRIGVVIAGADARVEDPVSSMSAFGGFQSQVDRNYTNLANGLLLSNAILPAGYRRRITLLTDGQENAGDALTVARLMHSLGVRVDVWPVRVKAGPEVLVDSVTAPSQLRPKERFSVAVAVRSTVNTSLDLTLYRDHAVVASARHRVHVGENHYLFGQGPLSPGFHTYEAHIDPILDTQPENNSGSAFTDVAGPPRVLVVSPSRSEASNVLDSLKTTGSIATFRYPWTLIPTLSYLQRYGAVVLIDTPADALDPQIVADLVPYVRDLGRGLVVLGGTESYGMGGYGQTGLETALPVKMELPKRKDLPSAAVALIIEDLESFTQVNISKEAGKGVVSLLNEQDEIAVNSALGGVFPVPLQHVTNKRAIDHAIDGMTPGDPMSYTPDLEAAFRVLKRAHTSVKHIILLGDGDAEDPGYERVVKRIRAGGVTVSTVATNGVGYSDFQTMRNIASWGGGRYYNAYNSSSIPRIFLRETRSVARSGIITGKFFPHELSANSMLRDLHRMTDLTGYVATTPKPTGEMVLVSKKLDPVLAAWQFGLGRSVAWTSDAAGLWTRDWLRAPGANRFWADLVGWTLPAAKTGRLFVSATANQGQGTIGVDPPSSLGVDPRVTARVLGPNLHPTTIQLQPTSPGHFQGTFAARSPGAYFVAAQARGAGHLEAGQAGLDVPYSAEYRTTGPDLSFMRAVAQAGGGSLVSKPGSVWRNNLPSVSARQSLSLWLWLLALLLLPIDIGIRRLVVSRRDLEVIRRALRPFRHPVPATAPALAPLGAVRQRRAQSLASSVAHGPQTSRADRQGDDPRNRDVRPNGDRVSAAGRTAATNLPASVSTSAAPGSREDLSPDSHPSDDGQTVAGRLLASKRRRK